MTPTPSVSLITVNYGDCATTARLLDSLERVDGLDRLRVVIVNNGADQTSREQLERIMEPRELRTSLLHAPENLFYWRGAALGLAWANRDERSDWSIVCNNDVEIRSPDFMTRLQARNIEHYPIIAPSIRSSLTDSEQNPLASERWGRGGLWKWRVFDSSLVGARILIAARRLGNAFVGRWGHPIQNGDSPEQRIYAPHGAMVILSRAFFEAGGFLDLSVPVFAEELSLAETARRLSLPVTFCPDLRVEHREHGTLGKALTRQTHTWARQAHRYLREAYFGENPEDLDVIRQRSRAPSIADVVASEVSS